MKDLFKLKPVINKKNRQIILNPPRRKMSKEILKLIDGKGKVKVRIFK